MGRIGFREGRVSESHSLLAQAEHLLSSALLEKGVDLLTDDDGAVSKCC